MKTKRGTRRAGLAVVALSCVTITGCGGGDDGTVVEDPVPATVAISPESATMTSINAVQGFTAVVRDQNGRVMQNATVSWSSSDAAVFTVDGSGSNATVTAAANGTETLTATSGQASGTASVEVAQAPAKLEMVSGDEQEAVRGTALAEPVVVRIEDQGGTAIEGVPVTFLPDEGHGSVSETMVETDADGMASTEWTLGVDLRMQSLVAFSGDASIRFRATATADPPMPDLVLKTFALSRTEPTELETVEITAVITNEGDGPGPVTFPVRLSLDGEPVESVDFEAIEPGASTTVELTIGPLEQGRYLVDFALDPDDEIEEWHEANNSGSENVFVQSQRIIELGESLELSGLAGQIMLFRVEIDEASDEALNAELSGGHGDADLFVHFADRPDNQYRYGCVSLAPATDEQCQVVPTRKGVYHVAVHAFSDFGPTTLTVTVGGKPVEDYNIDLVFVDGGTTAQDDIVREAAERWEAVIAKGAVDIDFAESPSLPCGPGSSVTSDVVDDLRIYVTIDSIDGAGGSDGNSVAESDWCVVRSYNISPRIYLEMITGYIHLDEHDVGEMEPDVLRSVVTHAMAHVLGFDLVVWDVHGHLKDPPLPGHREADTHFDGYLSITAFDAAGGTGYGGAKVPVENSGVTGSTNTHWRQSVFGDELMTPSITGTSQPLSLITIELLADLGYGVDLSQAESFSLSPAGSAGMELPRGPAIDLSNDTGQGPIALYDMKTGNVRIIHRPR